jgi:2-methylcitrate dehydratase
VSTARSKPPAPDEVIGRIARYVAEYRIQGSAAWASAHDCLLDSLGCAFEALAYPECMKLVGPVVPGTITPHGARVPGTPYVLDPVAAAFGISVLVRWLDYSDAYFGATVIHPSDTFGGILAVADWLSRTRRAEGRAPLLVRDVLQAAIQAYEIMGWLGLDNNFTRTGLDNTFLGKIAVAAVVTKMLGGGHAEIASAVSNAFIDGHALATFRRAPNTGARKSWASADAGSRGVRLALMAAKGEMGYPSALTARTWGFYDVLFGGKPFEFSRPLGTGIIENVVFKIAYPAALHAQTAVEAAIRLHPTVARRLDDILRIDVWTHETCILMIDKTGPLHNFADRDHCLQYMIAIGLIHGGLAARDYEDDVAADPRIDALRSKMTVHEDPAFSRGYRDPSRRTNANAIRLRFKDGSATARTAVDYPLGHPARRRDAQPLRRQKFERNVVRAYAPKAAHAIVSAFAHGERLARTPVDDFMNLLAA